MWVLGEMVPKHELFKNISLHTQELNSEKNIYELKNHAREKTLSSNLPLKLGLAKKSPFTSFLSHLLEST
jgi:hypothetical protein